LVSRKWITVTLTPEPGSVAARVLFLNALEAEGLLTDDITDRLSVLDNDDDDDGEVPVLDDETVPLLLAISDIHTRSGADRCSTRECGRRFDQDRCLLVAAN
jgi:hypothetical protein